MEEKLVNAPASDMLEHYCGKELMGAIEENDVRAFRNAFEALILNYFDEENEQHADA